MRAKGKGALSRKSGASRSQARQSDDTSQLFSSFAKDNNDGSSSPKHQANLQSLSVPRKNASTFFSNLPPELRNLSSQQLLNSGAANAYQKMMF